MSDAPPTPTVPHGFYPALTHFTDAITALPREFRRHNSLLKEVDAKAWALEENLLQLLKVSSESQAVQHPPNPAPIVAGVIRDDILPQVDLYCELRKTGIDRRMKLTEFASTESLTTNRVAGKQKSSSPF